jgi:hypothetical protein
LPTGLWHYWRSLRQQPLRSCWRRER